MRYFLLQGPFAQAIFVVFQSRNLIYSVTSLLANIGVWTVAPQMTDKSLKNFEQFALRRLHARATEDSPSRYLSGYEVHVFRILTNFLSFRFITEIICF